MSKASREVPLSLVHLFLGFRFSSLVSVAQLGALTQWPNCFWWFFLVKLKKFYCCRSRILSFKSLLYVEWLYQVVGNYILAGPGSANSFQTCLREPSWAVQTALAESLIRVFFISCERCLEQYKYVGNTKLQLISAFCSSACLFVWKKVICCQPSQWLHAGAEWYLKGLQALVTCDHFNLPRQNDFHQISGDTQCVIVMYNLQCLLGPGVIFKKQFLFGSKE